MFTLMKHRAADFFDMNLARLASVTELESKRFRLLMERLERFAAKYELRPTRGLSKEWEYPFLLFNAVLERIKGICILDIGSEMSPVPWYLGEFNYVTIVETEAMECLREKWDPLMSATMNYDFVPDESLPYADESFDLVTSFSVIEHQPNKVKAISEAIRVLKPGGTLAISFDIVEPSMVMTYLASVGKPLTIDQFERLIWFRPEFGNKEKPAWNMEDIPEFIEWHRRGRCVRVFQGPQEGVIDDYWRNHTVGAAVLKKL